MKRRTPHTRSTRLKRIWIAAAFAYLLAAFQSTAAGQTWTIDDAADWNAAVAKAENLDLVDGRAVPTTNTAAFSSRIKAYDAPRKAVALTFRQSPAWDNWKKIPSAKPERVGNAPIFLPVADKNYYFFACNGKRFPYHGWHSTDMKAWKHLGVIAKSHWATTAEYKDGKVYLYYDQPNDGKPHLVIDPRYPPAGASALSFAPCALKTRRRSQLSTKS